MGGGVVEQLLNKITNLENKVNELSNSEIKHLYRTHTVSLDVATEIIKLANFNTPDGITAKGGVCYVSLSREPKSPIPLFTLQSAVISPTPIDIFKNSDLTYRIPFGSGKLIIQLPREYSNDVKFSHDDVGIVIKVYTIYKI